MEGGSCTRSRRPPGWGLSRRPALARLRREGRGPARLHGLSAAEATYAELLRRARGGLEQGESVVLDASWSDAGRRQEAAEVSHQTFSDLVQLRCQVPTAVADARLLARTGDASDADREVAADMRRRFADWPQAHVLSTAESIEETVAAAGRVLAADLS